MVEIRGDIMSIENMTEEQMRSRMKEIDKERDKLRDERKVYEDYFYYKKLEEKHDNHKLYEGKCFLTKGHKSNKHSHIKAFKIIRVLDAPNENMAECLALVDGHRSSCWNEYGIQIMTFGVWSYNELRLMNKETDPKMIDFYKEISIEKFEELYKEHYVNVAEKVVY